MQSDRVGIIGPDYTQTSHLLVAKHSFDEGIVELRDVEEDWFRTMDLVIDTRDQGYD